MNIKSVSIQGWRSYSSTEGVTLDNLKKINVIIGPNNSGKSNLFKYLFHIRSIVRNTTSERGRRGELADYDLLNCVPSAFSVSDTWSDEGQDIICRIQLEGISGLSYGGVVPTLHQSREITLKAHHKVNERKSCFSVNYEQDLYLLEEFQENNPKILNPTNKLYENPVEGVGYPQDTVAYWKTFIESLVFVDPVRHHSRNRSEFNESDFDGSNIVEEIIRVRNEHDTEWREYKNCLEDWLKTILLESSLVLDPTHNKLRFYITRGSREISASLENLGTGVSQLVMLLSYLYLNRHKKLNVFIEEPESNLHPEAVVQLVKIMERNFQKHRFFITTHSSILIDQLNDNWSIHRIYRKDVHASNILPCTEALHQYGLLDELGIRPSQLLQSNSVIWVEGPSDRTYVNKWIKDNSDLLEGKHYSFLMYGGANLANYDLFDNDDYINVLRTSRYSIILCDSDKSSEQDELKERVRKLIQRVTETSFDDGRSLKDYVHIWVTSGREIENYIPKVLFESILFSEPYLRKYIIVDTGNGQKQRKNLKVSMDVTVPNPYESFDKFYAHKYIFEDDTQLLPEHVTSIANDFSKKKASIAKSLIEKWSSEHYSDELNRSIADLLEHIKKANYFGAI
ncbi:ATP-binding protein [Paenibacillus polymyxa]|uniref:ATP-dependent nuclease n=1 Tax=Paenibacillus polymyxa TaxID=1406 RepID=UPI002ED5AD2D|nr:ATP-binding protein [Paenibacillus polymyxa]